MYVLGKGVSWANVPTERIGYIGGTCRRRLREWAKAGRTAELGQKINYTALMPDQPAQDS
ncbi:hypothetical protein O1L44_00145 [Streptomyces noursei]|nr:Putative transposase of IS4/5 family (DUF4096) [Streptomyces noursei ATCC 11455]MCZ0991865.1 hypothetical protein [Streptomyces noursei]